MGISTEMLDYLNAKNRRSQLGTLIQNAESISNATMMAEPLTGFSSSAGALAAGDTLIEGISKLDGNIGLKLATADFTSAAVNAKLLTGFSSSAGVIAGTDSILVGFNKIVGNLAGKFPNKYIFLSGKFTTVGGDASETITGATGVVGTDIVMVQVQSGTGYVVSAAAGTGDIGVVMSADPGGATILNWIVFR